MKFSAFYTLSPATRGTAANTATRTLLTFTACILSGILLVSCATNENTQAATDDSSQKPVQHQLHNSKKASSAVTVKKPAQTAYKPVIKPVQNGILGTIPVSQLKTPAPKPQATAKTAPAPVIPTATYVKPVTTAAAQPTPLALSNTKPASAPEFRHKTTGTELPLAIGDTIRMTVLEDPSLSGEFLIDDRGLVKLPLIGNVHIADKTTEQVEAMLITRYSQGYLVSPNIMVEAASLRPFYILGEVSKPGVYPYTPSLNVFKAIATAGGFTSRAQKDDFTIIRIINGKPEELEAEALTVVKPGDAIRVDERFF